MKDFVPKELNARTRSNILVVAAGIGMYAVLLYFGHIAGFLKSLYGIISPFLIGIVVAFLLNSPLKRVEKLLTKWLSRKKPHKKLCRVLGVIVCYIGFLGLLAAFFRHTGAAAGAVDPLDHRVRDQFPRCKYG